MELTESQLKMIQTCKSNGYGWKKFALNIEKQGFCTPKQYEVLFNMCWKIEQAKKRQEASKCWVRNKGTKKSYKHDISDCEAMQSGDFF